MLLPCLLSWAVLLLPSAMALALPCASGIPADTADDLIVNLGYAHYRGYRNKTLNGLRVWRGLRYAQPPVGALRWRAPRQLPPSHNQTVQNATTFQAQCPQTANAIPQFPSPNQPPVSEDCLFLNVYAPQQTPRHGAPVLIWIHGGGYGQGNSRDDPSELILNGTASQLAEQIVVVTSEYRLGALGFASSTKIYEDGDLNVGLLDQQEVMRWVQQHIHKFGGNPNRVTVAGESAGGGSVLIHAVAYNGTLGTSLFKQLITSSPSIHKPVKYDNSLVQAAFEQFAVGAGCPLDRHTMACLRRASLEAINASSNAVSMSGVYASWAFNPVADGKLLVDLPSRLLKHRCVNGERMLTGNNAEEGPMFVPQNLTNLADATSWIAALYPGLGLKKLQEAIDMYLPFAPGLGPNETYATTGFGSPSTSSVQSTGVHAQALADTIMAESTYICTSYWLADAYSYAPRKSWKYQHSVVPAIHASDVPAIFSNQGQPWQLSRLGRHYRAALQSIWRGFITTGSPTSEASIFGNVSDRTALNLYFVNGTRVPPAVDGAPDSLGPQWRSWDSRRPVMLNLNQTGGIESSWYVYGYHNTTVHVNPGLTNDFSLVRADEWESGRGRRCRWWRNNMWKIPG